MLDDDDEDGEIVGDEEQIDDGDDDESDLEIIGEHEHHGNLFVCVISINIVCLADLPPLMQQQQQHGNIDDDEQEQQQMMGDEFAQDDDDKVEELIDDDDTNERFVCVCLNKTYVFTLTVMMNNI
jgi:hypothetical protein